jgi:transposase
MRPKGNSDELQRRRERAVELFKQGKRKADIARLVGTSRASVTRWCQAYERAGPKGIKARPQPGRPPKLSGRQKKKLLQHILQGAKANGFPTNLWTGKRIVFLIEKMFGVEYHPDSMPRFLCSLGLTCQKPQKRAVERDEERIGSWVARDWRRTKKGLHAEQST